MRRVSATLASGLITGLIASIGAPGGLAAQDGRVEVTEARKKACAAAEKQFEKLFPDYKPEPGVAVVLTYKYNFCPVNLEVKRGTKVRWINVERRTSHSVWLKQAGKKESPRLFPEEIWEFTFDQSGAYPYLCGPHWEQEKMVGYVKVVD